MERNLSKEKQLILAIEHLALGREYVIRKNRLAVTELVQFHEDLQHQSGAIIEQNEWGLERKYHKYRSAFQHFNLPIALNFKQGAIKNFDGHPETIARLIRIYLHHLVPNYSEDAATLFIRNRVVPEEALFLLVSLKYAAQHRLACRFSYSKLFWRITAPRNVLPLGFIVNGPYLNIVATDPTSMTAKQFAMSRIGALHSDLYGDFLREAKTQAFAFDPEAYLRSREGSFHRPARTYVVVMLGNTYDHFKHTFNLDHRMISGRESQCRVAVECTDESLIHEVCLKYGAWCKLESPVDAVERLSNRIALLHQTYSARSPDDTAGRK